MISGRPYLPHSEWQPLREGIEKLLTAYDWGESFVGLNLVLKPLVDQLFMKHLSDLALERGASEERSYGILCAPLVCSYLLSIDMLGCALA